MRVPDSWESSVLRQGTLLHMHIAYLYPGMTEFIIECDQEKMNSSSLGATLRDYHK